ncbi:MAG TPA: hypothetical protein VFC19_43500 [Candidatus Limnocylindrales bacterium]|nr:hypothetical protein [Candidatus Limnocylindrales bacterium]
MSRTRNRKRKRAQPVKPPITSPVQQREPKRRLRSSYVILGSVGTLFAGLCIYGVVRDRDRTCVDANNYVVPKSQCETGSGGARWYYGGNNSGGRMGGGSFERGGFGGHGGGGS